MTNQSFYGLNIDVKRAATMLNKYKLGSKEFIAIESFGIIPYRTISQLFRTFKSTGVKAVRLRRLDNSDLEISWGRKNVYVLRTFSLDRAVENWNPIECEAK